MRDAALSGSVATHNDLKRIPSNSIQNEYELAALRKYGGGAGALGIVGGVPWDNRNYWKSSFLRDLPDVAIDDVVEHANQSKSPLSAVIIKYYGGAASRVAVDATAFPHREASFNIVILGQWSDAAEDPMHFNWVRNCWEAVNPWASGAVYMNALSGTSGETIKVDNEGRAQDDASQTGRTAARAGIGAAVGAVIGAIVGGGKGAAIGAAVGAGASAGAVYVQGRDDLDLVSGTEFMLRASAPR